MKQRTRKLVGTVLILVFVCVYALVAMALAQGRITEAPKLVQESPMSRSASPGSCRCCR